MCVGFIYQNTLWVAGKLVSFTTRSECIAYGQQVWAYCINASKIQKMTKFTQYDMKSFHISLFIIVQIYKRATVTV